MKTIASQVSEYVKTKPYLSTALSQGIINLTSLAREIQPEIEKALRKPARSGSHRYGIKANIRQRGVPLHPQDCQCIEKPGGHHRSFLFDRLLL